jgi:transcriptional regulator with GAF, ATPase, and Fis domain
MALAYPTLAVGEQADTASARSVISQLFGDRLGLQSSMWVPVLSKSQPIAALILASSAAYAFTTKDVRTLQELSGRVALALENLLAFEHITRLNEQLRQEKTYLSEEIRAAFHFEEFIGTSPALLTVVERVNQAGPSDYPVLVIGETGTGKEFIARAVHNASRRKGQALIKVICTALSPQLLAAEIFGQEFDDSTPASERRIGKLELAHAGSLFLDEVGELPLELQAELLGAMQTKKIARLGGQTPIAVDVRIIAATSRDLSQEVVAGRFLPDLYYLLNSGLIEAPTLRQRSDDIPLLAMHFLPQISKKLGKTITSISDSALYQLKRYAWPGNIRELQQVLERMAMLSPAPTLELAEPLATFRLPPTSAPPTGMVRPLHEAMREAILAALAQSRHRIRGAGGAAELLGIKPTTLEARMKKLRIGPGQSLS